MLGTRTKQVSAYGRRAHRIVNAADDRKEESSCGPSLFPTNRLERKSRIEHVPHPPAVTLQTAASSSSSESSPEITVKTFTSHRRRETQKTPKGRQLSPARKPLSAVSSNLPSPCSAVSPGHVPKKRKASSKLVRGAPMKPLKSTSPIVEVDIVILDPRGHKVSQERRISRRDVQSNPVTKPQIKRVKKASPGSSIQHAIVLSDGEDKVAVAKKPLNHSRTRTIAISSDEESDEEPTPATRLPSLQLSPESYLPKPIVRQNRRPVAVLSPSTSPEIEIVAKASSSAHIRHVKPCGSCKPPAKDATAVPVNSQSAARVEAVCPSSFLSPPAPHFKSRQLTPIRYGGRRPSFFPVPSSPSTDTESEFEDLSFDLSQLALTPRTLKQVNAEFDLHEQPPPKYLIPLLEECSQTALHEFSAFIEMFPLDPIVHTSHGGVGIIGSKGSKGPVSFQKIGEASYSEVFGIGDVVLKVIPLRDEYGVKPAFDDSDSPAPSDTKDVLKEMIVTRAMGEMCGGFVELLRTYIVRGRYPSLLLDLWDEYNDRKGSENVRPDTFTVSQVYAIIVLPNGGPDLEAYTFPTASKTGWRQASSLFWQVARTLAVAEDLVRFEHRDLHWGQILVKSAISTTQPRVSKNKKVPMDHESYGVRATVIDLGLSRMDSDEGDSESVHYTPFDDEVFEGEGDYQFDIYRMMKLHIGDSWKTYRPLTNVMWLHYLAIKLLNAKRLRAPAVPRKETSSVTFTERECYECLVEVEAVLRAAVSLYNSSASKKGRRKIQTMTKVVTDAGLRDAAGVLNFGIKRGWVLADH